MKSPGSALQRRNCIAINGGVLNSLLVPNALSSAALSSAELQQLLQPLALNVPTRLPLMDLPNPLSLFHIQTPGFLQVLSFLLGHPVITAGLALFLYLVIPRLWRAVIRFVVIPAGVLGTLYVVVKNPQSFSSAGSFVANFTTDHPYVTSAAILTGITLVLSPYLLTVLVVLFLVTGIPRLPAPLRHFLPEPIVELERQLGSFDDVIREPVQNLKDATGKLGSGLLNTLDTASSPLKQLQGGQAKDVEQRR